MAQAAATAAQAFTVAFVLEAQGRIADAEQVYRKTLTLEPDHFDALLALGTLCLMRGAAADAVPALEHAVAVAPDSADAHHRLGMGLAQLGRFGEAVPEYREAITLAPQNAKMANDLGAALAQLQRQDEAITQFEAALALAPDDAMVHNNLGNALVVVKRMRDAIAHFERAISLRPDYPLAEFNLAGALAKRERHDEAFEHYRKALASRPEWIAALCGLGFSLFLSDQVEEGLASYERALSLDPAHADAHHGVGLTKQALGRLPESRLAFEKAVELAPAVPAYHRSLAETKRFRGDDPQLAAMEELAQRIDSYGEEQQAALHFGLAKAYSDLGRYPISFDHLAQGNAIRHRLDEYDERAQLDMMRHIEKVFTAELLRRRPGAGDPSPLPILIVSMPRSGSTLIEQILASHPRIFGAGEMRFVGRATKALRGRTVQEFFPEVANHLSAEQLRQYGARYVGQLRSLAPTAERVTDKMPSNYLYLGLIHMALPNARIIHARRDPLDTCVSCFAHNFGTKSFSSDLGTLGRYYRSYEALMAHWRAVLPPGVMLEVQYEELVADFESHARRIVEFCGLEWDPRCLAFYETTRPVRTASVTQVREPIFKTSIGRWRVYEPWLSPLLKALSVGETPS